MEWSTTLHGVVDAIVFLLEEVDQLYLARGNIKILHRNTTRSYEIDQLCRC